MKAMLQPAYGLPDVLQMAEVPLPQLSKDALLVRVGVAGLTKGDWHLLTGKPYLIRMMGFGLFKPKNVIPGLAVAGRVEAVGDAVKAFKVGDMVLGEISQGGFAEYVCASEAVWALKPDALSVEAAATLPISATTALQGLRDAGGLKAGQSVLIHGAAGGVGTFAVQIAKAMGAKVTAVCSTANVDLLRSLGADHVIDYRKEDFSRGDQRYDMIFDLIGNQPLSACRRVLTAHGRLVAAAGGADHEWVGPMLGLVMGLLSNLFSQQKFVPLAAKPNPEDLRILGEMVVAGQVMPVIDRRSSLSELPEAMRYLGQGHSRGKNVITFEP